MDLEAVDYFIRVAEAPSMSHAAKLYGVPKSSLSHKIRKLEDTLGVALFIRDGRDTRAFEVARAAGRGIHAGTFIHPSDWRDGVRW